MRSRRPPFVAAMLLSIMLAGCDASDALVEPVGEAVLDLYDMKLTPRSGTSSQAMETTVWLNVTPYSSSLSVKLVLVTPGAEVTLSTHQAAGTKGRSQLSYGVAKISDLQARVDGAKTMVFRWMVFNGMGSMQDMVEDTLTVVGTQER